MVIFIFWYTRIHCISMMQLLIFISVDHKYFWTFDTWVEWMEYISSKITGPYTSGKNSYHLPPFDHGKASRSFNCLHFNDQGTGNNQCSKPDICCLYSRSTALHIIWDRPELFSNFIPRLGGMHFIMNMIGSIGTLAADSGCAENLGAAAMP